MDNRWFKRVPMRLNVLMHYSPLGIINGTTQNVSSSGMFIATGRITLIAEELLSLHFRYPDQLEGKLYTVDAQIIHTCQDGAGLQFIKFQLDPAELPLNYRIS